MDLILALNLQTSPFRVVLLEMVGVKKMLIEWWRRQTLNVGGEGARHGRYFGSQSANVRQSKRQECKKLEAD